MASGATAIAVAARTCAALPPPSSRASRPVSSTSRAEATADGSRSNTRDDRARSDITRAISGNSGGWSG